MSESTTSTSDSTSQSQSQYHEKGTFSTLPAELRLLIWKQALLPYKIPKVHSILPARSDPSVFISNIPISNLLHICSESRSLYLTKLNPTFCYGTYINFPADTLYLADCPSPSKSAYSDGFEVCKELGRDKELCAKVKKLAVKDTFWLRPNTITRSIAVDAWNVVVKGDIRGLEELLVVFEDLRQGDERRDEVKFDIVGSYHRGLRDGVGERERRCDEFLRMYLGYFPAEMRWVRPSIKYAIVSRQGEVKNSVEC